MLLTIHNLPPSSRYSDIKSLLIGKCGLTEIILDNLANEGNGKKVTVGLANDDDGALVVRKLNGLFLDGHQLYIEDRRRKTAEHDQPYRSSANLNQEARAVPPLSNSAMPGGMPMAANVAMSSKYNVAAPYMSQMPVEQNFAYASYGGAPQATRYMEPQPVVPVEREYLAFKGEGYHPGPPGNGARDQEPGAWPRSSRDQGPDIRYQDQKRRHSPERPAVPKKRGSRWIEKEVPMHREASPLRHQHPLEMNQGPRQPYRQPEHLSRNQNQYQPREPNPEYRRTDPQWENRWDDPNHRVERERDWGNDNNRNWGPESVKVWEEPNQQWHDEPRRGMHRPNPHWERNYSGSPDKEVRSVWLDRQMPEDNPLDQYPRDQGPYERAPYDREPRPRQRDTDRPDLFHQNDRNAPENWNREPMPEDFGASRSGGSLIRNVRHAVKTERRDRSRSNNARPIRDRREERPNNARPARDRREERPNNTRPGRDWLEERPNNARPGRDWREDKPNTSQDRSEDVREKPDYWRQVANDYPEPRRPEFDRRDANNAPRQDMKPNYRQDTPKKPLIKGNIKYPPKEDRRVPHAVPRKPIETRFENPNRKPKTVTSMINRDASTRSQATALIAKKILGVQSKSQHFYFTTSPLNAYIFQQMKLCIRSRIDVLLGEELISDIADVVSRYRLKFPESGDDELLKQIREKGTREYNAMKEEQKTESGITDQKGELEPSGLRRRRYEDSNDNKKMQPRQ